jgi:ribosomal protein S18
VEKRTNYKDRGGFRKRRKKECYFTKNKIKHIDYKDAELLVKFVSDRGKILPRRVTGTTAKYQRNWRLRSSVHAIWHCYHLARFNLRFPSMGNRFFV